VNGFVNPVFVYIAVPESVISVTLQAVYTVVFNGVLQAQVPKVQVPPVHFDTNHCLYAQVAVGVVVGVLVGVGVGVLVAVDVGVTPGVLVGVTVGVLVAVADGVNDFVGVLLGV
jgi:hypothetical protein